MYKLSNITIIGAGGVASYLLRPLILSFQPDSISIWDADKLEKRNLERQLFHIKAVGQNKAKALAALHQDVSKDTSILFMDQYLTDTSHFDVTPDLLICCADNHEARRNVLAKADELQIPAIIGGNEYFDSEAYIYYPKWKDTRLDPRIRFPEILTSTAGSPIHCDTHEAIQANPQLPIANMSCATSILSLMWMWAQETTVGVRAVELFRGLHEDSRFESSLTNPITP